MSEALRTVLDSLDLIAFAALLGLGYFIGRRNERQHLADLARRERELRAVTLFATRYPPIHATLHDPLLVSGSAVIAADAFKMFVAGLRKLLGGRFQAYETLIDRARREALLRMKAQAQKAGCTMIFNVRVETTQLMSGNRGGSTAVEVFAYGTAFAPAAGSVADSAHAYVPGPPLPAVEGFDLKKNQATKWILIAWFSVVAYCFVELVFLGEYWYLGAAPWNAFLLLSVPLVAGAVFAMRRHKVPLAETVMLAILLALTLPPLWFFPALRLNALTDFSRASESIYVLQEDRSLQPAAPGDPVLRFPEHAEYWEAQEIGSEHRFTLRHGWLGFWQMGREPYDAQLTAFYRALGDASPASAGGRE